MFFKVHRVIKGPYFAECWWFSQFFAPHYCSVYCSVNNYSSYLLNLILSNYIVCYFRIVAIIGCVGNWSALVANIMGRFTVHLWRWVIGSPQVLCLWVAYCNSGPQCFIVLCLFSRWWILSIKDTETHLQILYKVSNSRSPSRSFSTCYCAAVRSQI